MLAVQAETLETGDILYEEQAVAPRLGPSLGRSPPLSLPLPLSLPTPHPAPRTPREMQAPLAPAFAFTGEVKRTEWYSTVSPALLERAFTTVRVRMCMH